MANKPLVIKCRLTVPAGDDDRLFKIYTKITGGEFTITNKSDLYPLRDDKTKANFYLDLLIWDMEDPNNGHSK
jgi:hypothetical protein